MILLTMLMTASAGCAGNENGQSAFDPSRYRMPSDYEPVVFEVTRGSYGHPMELYTIDDSYNKSQEIEDWYREKNLSESRERYWVMSRAWRSMDSEKDAHFAEENRIEAYCKEYGFEKCMNIDRACDGDGCRKVTVSCDDDDYDPGIDDYEECSSAVVTVEEDYDETLTQEQDLNCW